MDRVAYTLDDDQARRFFEFAGFRARNLSDPLRRAGATLLHHIARTFETEGDWIGHPWPLLDEGYAAWKEQHAPGRPMLVLTGLLRRMAISRSAVHVTGNQLSWTVNLPYAHIQQEGATWMTLRKVGGKFRPHVAHIPARPFVQVTPGLVEAIEQDFRVWLEELKSVNRARSGLSIPNPFN